MPNWCNNRLEVSGDTNELKKFLKIGITEQPVRYSETGEKELVWRMSKYLPTPEPLSRTISPARDCKWVNEWDVNNAKKRKENGEDVVIPELIECANGTEEKREDLIRQYGTDNWYDWNVMNWGSKWDCSSEEMGFDTDNENYITINFTSAWSPPIKWLGKVIKMFPNLNFKLVFMETGNWFAGCAYSEDGELTVTEGEPEYVVDGVVYNYDTEQGVYVGEDGNVISQEEWNNEGSWETIFPENPFDNFDAPWE